MAIDLSTASKSSNAPNAASSIVAAAGSPSESFTKLLVAQIKNQNPLEPSDPSEFVNQLTQMSQMESLQMLASQSSASASAMEGLQTLALGAQVGSQVVVATDHVVLDKEKVQGSFNLGSASAETSLILTAADGREQKIALGSQSSGEVPFSIDPVKLGLAPGPYALRVETSTKDSPVINVAGTLSSVKLTNAGPVLDVTHVGQVSSKSITQFNGKKTV